jgi:hypothetical protein
LPHSGDQAPKPDNQGAVDMVELVVAFGILGFLAMVAIPAIILMAAVGLVLKMAFLILLLPFKLLFAGLAGLFQVAGAILKFVAGFILFAIAAIVALALLLIPAVPVGALLLMIALTWLVVRLFRRPQRQTAQA